MGRTETMVRCAAALLAVAVAAIHVTDQGGITTLDSPAWIGWSYRLVEAGGILTALILLLGRPRWLGWAAGILLGAGPFLAYVISRSPIGLPGDHGDIGNWGQLLGIVALLTEGALVLLSAGMLLTSSQTIDYSPP